MSRALQREWLEPRAYIHGRPHLVDLMLTCRHLHGEIAHVLQRQYLTYISIRYLGDLLQHEQGSCGIGHCLGAPLSHIHPVVRDRKCVIGRWRGPKNGDDGRMIPTISPGFFHENSLKWKDLEMRVNQYLVGRESLKSPFERLRATLAVIRLTRVNVLELVQFDPPQDLRVSVLFRISDKEMGGVVCRVLVRAGAPSILFRHEAMPEDEEMKHLFVQFFGMQPVDHGVLRSFVGRLRWQ